MQLEEDKENQGELQIVEKMQTGNGEILTASISIVNAAKCPMRYISQSCQANLVLPPTRQKSSVHINYNLSKNKRWDNAIEI